MSWNQRVFEPKQAKGPVAERTRFASPPLSRFCGSVGWAVGGLAAFYGCTTLLGLDSNFLRAQGTWGWKEILVLLASLGSGLFCGLWGFAVGAAIKVESEGNNHVLAVFWHYLANGLLIWITLFWLVLAKTLGPDEAKATLERFGVGYTTFALLGPGAVGSLAMAGVLLWAGQLNPGAKPKFFACLLLSWPVAVALSYLQFRLFDVVTDLWLLPAAAFPVILIPLATMTVARDARQRRDHLARWNG